MQLGSISLPVGAALAPMAGVTDLAFRTVCAEQGACLTVTEMVSSRALCFQDQKTKRLLGRSRGVCGAQLFGNDPETMARAAQLALGLAPFDFIDLNMGCPMPKIVNNGDGSALLKDLPLAAEIIRAVADAVPVPVTVKARKGWDRGSVNVVQLAELAEQNGAAAICVHGRTRSMLYSGTADWDIIRAVKQAVTIPVIANGDVYSPETALRCLDRSRADLVMVGRAAFGDPWLFAQLRAALTGVRIPERPPLRERMALALRQIELAREDKGEHIACLEARKHLVWYLRGVPHSGYYKAKLGELRTMEDVYTVVKQIQRDLR